MTAIVTSLNPYISMYSFCKSERLCNKTLFEELINSGESFIKYPFRIVMKESSVKGEFPVRMAISVSKKKFKRAVKRNHIKRLAREAYRLNKPTLYENLSGDKTIDVLFIYLDHNLPEYSKAEKAIQSALQRINKHFSNAG